MRNLLTLILVLALPGCAQFLDPVPAQHVFEGVKRISPTVVSGEDESSYLESTYSISLESRLLLRYEKFHEHTAKIDTTENRVEAVVYLSNASDEASAVASLQLCPVTKQWMMLATWEVAFPFGENRWSSAGGDYDGPGCVTGVAASSSTKTKLTFNITSWFLDYPKGRGVNYGLILINESNSPITVVGDSSSTYAPRVEFNEYF